MLYVLSIPSSPAGLPQSPHWEVERGEETPLSLVTAGEALNVLLFLVGTCSSPATQYEVYLSLSFSLMGLKQTQSV